MKKEDILILYKLYFRKYRFKIIVILAILLLGTVLSMYQYVVNQYLIDTIIANKEYMRLFPFFFLFFGLSLLCYFLSWVVERANISVSQQCSIDMRTDLLRRVQSAKLEDVSHISSAAISTRIMEDVAYINSFFNNILVGNVSLIFSIVCLSVYLCSFSTVFFVIVFLPSVLQMVIMRLFSPKIRENQNDVRTVTQDHLNLLTRNMRCLQLLKAFLIRDQMMTDYFNCLKRIQRVSIKSFDIEYISNTCVSLVGILGDIGLLYTGSKMIMDDMLSLGAFVAIIGVASSLRGMLTQVVSVNIQLEKVKVSAQRITDILNIQPEMNGKEIKEIQKIEKVTFNNVSFSFLDEERRILDNFNVDFTNKTPYVVKGASGKGKSTILNLIMQNIETSSGKILANEDYSFAEHNMRNHVAVCYQDDVFAFDTIYDNLARSDEGLIPSEKIQEVLEVSEASTFVSKLAHGLDTKIDEALGNFSGGEIKRLSIARTLLKQADVYIFDESFACIDEEMRLRIFDKVLKKLKGKIVIVISHDDLFEKKFDVKTVYI